ncbi:helix-turn-helix domain-containing protein [Luteimonas sp. XNQY3]|nr:helix-turn-helix transcriptional regulator [Luteimonas sp. XNQY3]MCD9008119.1 helix-turn-helix domain-containing protein [Luteimonas sp. XNQY3]
MTTDQPGTIYGRRLREARESYKYSQTNLGIAAGFDETGTGSLISRYENGHHLPSLNRQKLLAKTLELPLTYFYIEDDTEAELVASAARSEKPVQKLIAIKNKRERMKKSK